ncbi:MAG: hypothetical protein M1826_000131 [Phylliscum demangeonii]|nr:MAG: hypothetical protein M1826_000131 [Phylliscum demangeonii]
MHFAAVLVPALAAAVSLAAPAPAPAPASGRSLPYLREHYFPGSQLKAADMDLPNNGGQPRFSARFWRQFFDKYPGRRPAIGATVEECTQNYVNLVTALGDTDRRRIHSFRSQCEDWHGVATCDKACVRAGVKAKKTNLERAEARELRRRAARELRRAEAAAAAAARSLLNMESRAAATAAAATAAAAGWRGAETRNGPDAGAGAGIWQKLERPFGLGAAE